jgi:hypothetical protein
MFRLTLALRNKIQPISSLLKLQGNKIMNKLLEKLDDATARLEQVICIAGAIGDGMSFAEPLRGFLVEDLDTMRKCFGTFPESVFDSLESDDNQEIAEAFSEWAIETDHLGFVVQIATPVMTPRGEDSNSYSWGYYSTRWVYADTFDGAVDAGLLWVDERRKAEQLWVDERRKAIANSGGS